MTLAGFICLVFRGGGDYRVIARDYAPAVSDEEWREDPLAVTGRPKPTGFYRRYDALCMTCRRDISTHLW